MKQQPKWAYSRAILVKNTGERLQIVADGYKNNGRINVSANLNHDEGRVSYVTPPRSVNLSYNRPPTALANEISRRLLPDLARIWKQNEQEIMKQKAKRERQKGLKALLVTRYRGQMSNTNAETVYTRYAEANVYTDGTIKLMLNSMDEELAIAILDMVHLAAGDPDN